MSVQQQTPCNAIFEDINANVRQVEIDLKFARFLKANNEYKRLYKTATTEELKAMPSGVLFYRTGLCRSITNASPLDHNQLIYYNQPLLGGASVDAILREINDDSTGKYAPEIKEYIRINRIQTFEYFPFAFQLAYDLYTTGTISDKANELKKIIDDRYAKILEEI